MHLLIDALLAMEKDVPDRQSEDVRFTADSRAVCRISAQILPEGPRLKSAYGVVTADQRARFDLQLAAIHVLEKPAATLCC